MNTSKVSPNTRKLDEYEDLLNTIEQEGQSHGMDVAATENLDLGSRRESDAMPSTMTIDRANLHEEEPIIDFELEQEMINMSDKQQNQ